ncbi:MAG TPA: diguanylate cyclase, partial [Candidatus Methylomirabilis sp.]
DEPLLRTIRARPEGVAEVGGPDGVVRLYAFTALRGTPNAIHVSIGIPKETALAGANRIFARSLWGLALGGLLAVVAAWIIGDLVILRRVNVLGGAAERLSAGDLSARAALRGRDEIGSMARAFNDMASRLETMVDTEHRAREALAEQVKQLVAERTREVELLNQMGEMLQACQSLEEAYSVVDELAGQIFAGDAGVVFILNAPRKLLEVAAVWGRSPAGKREVFAPEECWALRRGRAHLVEDTGSGLLCKHLPAPPPASYLCLPLVAHGEALGVLHLASAGEAPPGGAGITPARQRLADTVGRQLALSLANVRLRETLRIQSIRDPLTGLFNRRYMEEILEREVRWGERKFRPVGVIMLDIDHFKQVNDTFGHDAGDAVLREVGAMLQAKVRAVDVACRYGGEEFVLILPEASLENTRRRAEQLREAAKRHHISHEGKAIGQVSISLGAAVFPDHGATAEAVIRAADAALYRAKVAGRDRVVVAE